MDFINWGLIGFGNVVKNNVNGLPFNTKNSKIYAFHQRNSLEALELKRKYNINKFYDNPTELLLDKNINAIYICTPPGYHFKYANLCCNYLKPTYIEKPFARNYTECLEIVNNFKNNNIPLWIAHYKRTLPKFIKAKEILDSNILGKIFNVTYSCERIYNPSLKKHKWLYNVELSGGGRFFDIAPHTIDLLIYFFGNFESVHGIATNNSNDYPTEDIVSFNFKTLSNIVGTANFNFLSNRRTDLLKVYGSNGILSFSIEGGGDIILEKENTKELFSFSEPLIYEKNMVNAINNEILNNTLNNSICHGENALETYRVIDLILNDFYNGRTQDFWKRN